MIQNVLWNSGFKKEFADSKINVFYGNNTLKKTDTIAFSHYYLNKILSEYLEKKINSSDICRNKYNKPYIKNADIYFNLSHSQNAFLISVSKYESGIDIEDNSLDINYLDCMNYAFSDEELKYCNIDTSNNFFEVWTLKEAYLKAIGIGLTDNLKQINCLDNIIYENREMKHISFYSPKNEICSLVYSSNINHLQFIEIA